MTLTKIISVLGVLAMSAVLIFAFSTGDFFAEGAILTQMPWGIVSLVDLYTGFALFAVWIFYRESSILTAIIWTVLLMVLGFFTGSLYMLVAALTSGGNWQRFWLGKNAQQTS